MKVAITADLHLTNRDAHPERYQALEDILAQMKAEGIGHLIIAGDLFDASLQNYADFETLCKKTSEVEFLIIPGNHDADIHERKIVADNVHIYNEAEIVELIPDGFPFLMIPYKRGKTMGESIESFADRLEARKWVLVGHGDYSAGLQKPNPYEPGIYMPLTSIDLERYQPRRVFLGHIHEPHERGRVHYPGSPCGLDITEVGLRRFLLYDTDSDEIEVRNVATDVIYFDERFLVLPVEDEEAYVVKQIEARIASWGVPEGWEDRVRVRVSVEGYSADKRALKRAIERAFSKYSFYEAQDADLSRVSVSEDLDRMFIAERVLQRLNSLEWNYGGDEPEREEIMRAALKVIYEG